MDNAEINGQVEAIEEKKRALWSKVEAENLGFTPGEEVEAATYDIQIGKLKNQMQ
jgi:hypothetical protein